MNEDDRISQYLADRAGTITLPPGDASAVVQRATRRRHRRRTIVAVSIVTAAATATGAIVVNRPNEQRVESGFAAAPGASLEWTLVEPEVGLGWSAATATLGGTVYSLSTAPGPVDDSGSDPDPRRRLYRSDDGGEWTELALPDNLWASSLTSSGSRLYALGTAPAGGDSREVVVASSEDGEAWSSLSALPLDIAALEAAHGTRLYIGQLSVAAGPSGVVAAVSVGAAVDAARLLGREEDESLAWGITPEGLEIYVQQCSPDRRGMCEEEEERAPVETKTWEELEVSPELQSLFAGELHVFHSSDGSTFEPVAVDRGVGTSPNLVATDDAYHLFLQEWSPEENGVPSVRALRSSDGTTWEPSGLGDVPGYLVSAGVLAGRPAIATSDSSGSMLRVAQSDGTWSSVDMLSAIGSDVRRDEAGWTDVAFGPLGAAAVVWTGNGDDAHVLYTADGVSVSVESIDEHVGDVRPYVIGTAVTADAVVVRMTDPPDDDPQTMPTERLLVGTPR